MFDQIKATLGEKDGKGYQTKTAIEATLERLRDVEYSKSGKPGQSLFVTVGGESEWIKLIGEFDALTQSCVGQTYQFLVWPFKPEQSPKTYLYAWIQRQVKPQTPQPTPQTPQNAPQSTNAPTPTPQGVSDVERRCRVLEAVTRFYGGETNLQDLLAQCDMADVWVKSGEQIPF